MKALARRVFTARHHAPDDTTTTDYGFDLAAFERSRAVRAGRFLVNFAVTIKAAQTMLVMGATAALFVLSAVSPAAAQSIINANSQAPINAVKTWIDIFVWGLLAVGIGGAGWGVVNLMKGRAWGPQIIGAGAAFGFAGIVSLINTTTNDQAPTLPAF